MLVAQKVMTRQLDRLNRFEYSLSGSWYDPEIQQLDSGGTCRRSCGLWRVARSLAPNPPHRPRHLRPSDPQPPSPWGAEPNDTVAQPADESSGEKAGGTANEGCAG